MVLHRPVLLLLVDLVIVLAATVGALAIRDDLVLSVDRLAGAANYILLSLGAAAVAVTAFGQHRTIWRLTSGLDYQRMVWVALTTTAGAMTAAFLLDRLAGVPRSLPLLQCVLMIQCMAGARAVVRLAHLRRMRLPAPSGAEHALGASRSHVLVIGLGPLTELYLRGVVEVAQNEVEVVGILARTDRQVGRLAMTCPVLGKPEDVDKVLRELAVEGVAVDRIILTVPVGTLSAEARECLARIEGSQGIKLQHLENVAGLGPATAAPAARPEYSDAEKGLVAGNGYFRLKRVFDVAGALVLMLLAAPVFAMVALIVRLDVGARITFAQKRPGRFGRAFRVYKFRTMSPAFDVSGRRVADAKRSSWLGAALRRSRLDELPQLWNVLVGDMSFVGPRPLLPADQRPEFRARLLVRPGITGWAQVGGGRIVSPADKAAMDVWYVKNASLALDLRILLRTVRMLVLGDRVNLRAIEQAWRDMAPTGICAGWRREPGVPEQLAGGER